MHLFFNGKVLHRRRRVSPRRLMYLLIVLMVGPDYCVMCFAYDALHMPHQNLVILSCRKLNNKPFERYRNGPLLLNSITKLLNIFELLMSIKPETRGPSPCCLFLPSLNSNPHMSNIPRKESCVYSSKFKKFYKSSPVVCVCTHVHTFHWCTVASYFCRNTERFVRICVHKYVKPIEIGLARNFEIIFYTLSTYQNSAHRI